MDNFGEISPIESLPLPEGPHVKDFDAARAAAKKVARAAKKVAGSGVLPASAILATDSPGNESVLSTNGYSASSMNTFPGQLMFSATENSNEGAEWATPQEFFDLLDAEFHFTLDAAASESNHKCAAYYTNEQDALQQNWTGTVWCNPPFNRKHIAKWLTKGIEAARAGATVVFLLPVRTDTHWFHNLVEGMAEVRFVPGRIKFEHASGKNNAAPFPSMIAIYRPPVDVGTVRSTAGTPVTPATKTCPKIEVASLPALVEEIEMFLRQYVSFAQNHYTLPLALWAMATHVYEIFDAFPYLVLTAATRNSGKTRVMELMSFLSARSHSDADITPAALFAVIEKNKPTVFFDESERFAIAKSGFRGLLNNGYRKGSTVTRRQGNGFVEYRTYCPKCFALIGDVFDTMRDRSIVLNLRRGRAPHRFLFANASVEGKTLRDRIAAAIESYNHEIADTYSALPQLDFLADREEEIWSPLFAACRVFCPGRWQELERTAVDISTGKTVRPRKYTELAEHENAAQQLEYGERALRDLIRVIENRRRKSISTADAILALRDLPTGPWRAFRGEGLKPNIEGSMMLAALLEPFGVRPGTIRLRPKSQGAIGSTAKGYVLGDLIEAALKTGVFP